MKNLDKLLIVTLIFASTNTLLSQSFEEINAGLTGVSNSSVAWGDYDNDGYLDILLSGHTGSEAISKIYKNNGNNTFTEQTEIYLIGLNHTSASWGDYDNDGDLDILIIGYRNQGETSIIYKNNGDNTFAELTAVSLSGVWTGSVAWGDYDNDGDLDILLTGKSGDCISKIYKNCGDDIFTEQTGIELIGVQNSSIAWGDYDNDGDLDILLSGNTHPSSTDPTSKIYKNNGDNTFTEQTDIFLTDIRSGSVAWGDYDNDGYLDILLSGSANSENISKIYKNNGDNTFTERTDILLTGVTSGSVAWGDYDNDGHLDILLTGTANSEIISKIYRNNGPLIGGFTEQTGVSLTNVYNSSVAWGDCDNDGDLDILLTGSDENNNQIAKIYRNNSSISNTVPDTPQNLTSLVEGNKVNLSWDNSTDQENTVKSLTYNLYLYKAGFNFSLTPHADTAVGFRIIPVQGNIMDTSYTIMNLDTGTYFWGVQAIDHNFAGSGFADEANFTISFTNSIAPVDDQSLGQVENGIPLNVSEETEPADSRQWKYSLTPGGPYNNILGGETAPTYLPNFTEFATYYVVCVSEKDGFSVVSNEVKIEVVQFAEQTEVSLLNVSSSSVAWGDYDNDGDLDILLTGESDSTNSKIYRNLGNNIFEEQTDIIIAGVRRSSVAWGDYDNDGYIDILMTGQGTGPYSSEFISKIYKNNGDNTFIEQTDIVLPGVYFGSVVWSDLDRDGDLDLIITGTDINSEALSKVYFNMNDSFIESDLYLREGQDVAIADYNNDLYPDILIAGKDINGITHTTLYKNNKDKTFTEQTDILLTGASWACLTWGDYNNDNYLDILITGLNPDEGGFSKIYKNNGSGDFDFTEQTDITLAEVYHSSAAWGDYDNDGNLDILLTGRDRFQNQISLIYKNNGDNTFTEQIQIVLTDVELSSTAWGDYDNDGDLDILLTGENEYSNAVSKIYKNNNVTGNTTPDIPQNLEQEVMGNKVRLFWNQASDNETPGQTLSYNISVGTSPGACDIVSPMSDTETGYIRLPALGNCYLSNEFILNELDTGTYYWSVQTVDNGFFYSDFAEEHTFTVLPQFTEQTDIELTAARNSSLAWGDYDNDGDLDILLTGRDENNDNNSKIYHNNGPESYGFTEQTSISLTAVGYSSVAWGDYDNDNLIDILITGYSSTGHTSKIYKNNGNGTFTEQITIQLIQISSGSVAWGDYDNDGDLDIILAGSSAQGTIVKIYNNNGDNAFTEQTDFSFSYITSTSLACGDYDNDGDLDILLSGEISPNSTISKIYKNNGDNSFSEQTDIVLQGICKGSVAWNDYDNDGDLDILLAGMVSQGGDPETKIYRNDGNNTFTDLNVNIRKVSYSSVAWGDYDNDGYTDILIAGRSGTDITKVYSNNHDGTFSDINAAIIGTDYGPAIWGDYDNDGDLDILFGYYWSTKLYNNNTNYPNHLPTAPLNLQSELSGFDMKLNWDKASDPNCPEGSVYYNLRIGTSPGGIEIMSPMAHLTDGYRNIPAIGNAQCNTFWYIKNLAPGQTYYWSVQAIDQSFTGGPWATEESFTIPNISVDFNADTVCFGKSTNFMDNSLSPEETITSWNWDFGDGNTSVVQNPVHLYGTAGTFSVSLTVGSASYSHSITKNVNVKPAPFAYFNVDTVCQGSPTSILNLSQIDDEINVTWLWDMGDGTEFTAEQPPKYGYLNPGIYPVKLMITADNGCVDSTEQNAIVVKKPDGFINVEGIACQGEDYHLYVENDPNYSYAWTYEGSLIPNANAYLHIPESTGNYSVNIKGKGCANVQANHTVDASATTISSEGIACANGSYQIFADDYANYTYQWYFNDVLLTDESSSFIFPTENGQYKVKVTGTGCPEANGSFNVNLTDGPDIPEMYLRGPVVWYIACSNTTATTYKWYKNGTEIPNSNMQIIVPNPADGSYYVELNDGGECWTKSETVVIPDDFYSGKFKSFEEMTDLQDVETGMALFPNPSNGKFTLLFKDEFTGKIYIKLKDLNGKTLRQYYSNKTQEVYLEEMDLSKYGTGIYFIEIEYDKMKDVKKIVIE